MACASVAPAVAMIRSATAAGPILSSLSMARMRRRGVGHAEPAVEALAQLAVVHLDRHRRDRQAGQRVADHQRHLDVVAGSRSVSRSTMSMSAWSELAVAALLRPLAAPDLLDLVAAERELQLAGVLHDVPGERHGQVEVQAERRRPTRRSGRPAAGAARRPPWRSRPCAAAVSSGSTARVSSGAKPYSSNVRVQPRDDLLLDHALRRQPFREAGQRRDLRCHVDVYKPRGGGAARSHRWQRRLPQVRVARALPADGRGRVRGRAARPSRRAG